MKLTDFEKIKALYKLGKNLTLSDIQILIKSAKTKSFLPGEFLIKEGEIKKEIFLIKKGLVRTYKVNDKGDEITTLIRYENQVIASPDIIFFNKPSEFYFEAFEPTEVIYMDYDVLQKLIDSNPKLEANRKFFLHNILKDLLKRVDSFVLLSPEERYLEFIKTHPDIINRIPNKHIANLLGITPVSLSRIRKRIVTKNK
ncbi:Crp/Fnr family transcriptional regulator [Mesoflavibacter sp. CH_XMU1404-2]|uniref:Crp/Fnr family transcriptional regulator n=1 Tax=Mesoflavibacter sp. CH_XMU1404-2 TaxID=3107766 RepID=UPI00300B07E3